MLRRESPPPEAPPLPSSIVDVLIGGWTGPTSVPTDDQFLVFELGEDDLRDLWHQHRDWLETEARRRGVGRCWAEEEFDERSTP